jgi:hypothetical protein
VDKSISRAVWVGGQSDYLDVKTELSEEIMNCSIAVAPNVTPVHTSARFAPVAYPHTQPPKCLGTLDMHISVDPLSE